jgi:hypothetical protein
MKPFALEDWLKAHSTKVERIGAEIVFTHVSGETSVLLPRDTWRDSTLSVEVEPLASFYGEYFGASVGNSQLTFATNVAGGLDVSHGFRLPDFEQMAAQARELGVHVGEFEHIFLAEAAWMFVYTVDCESGQPVLRKYDRELGTNRIIESLDVVLEAWWKMVLADQDVSTNK